jgi:nitronate monooxygenase
MPDLKSPEAAAPLLSTTHPRIIQGGMGVGVSRWQLARAVSKAGQLGVVSGTALAIIQSRRLQLGDAGGDVRRAMEHFPFPAMSRRIFEKYYIPGGKAAGHPFKLPPMPAVQFGRELMELTVVSNFIEVFLAKEGHGGVVGVNYLEKLQHATLPSLFGAMLAGVDYVLIGAGIPRAIPGALQRLADGEAAQLKVDVAGLSAGEEIVCTFDPRELCGVGAAPALKWPKFLAIVSSATLATALARKSNGPVDGFIVEGATAGGHNAPPRGTARFNQRGEPLYGPLDIADLDRFRGLGLPFWLAGSYADPDKLAEALQWGAAGIQVGTAFAFCSESGITASLKQRVIEQARRGTTDVLTDPKASPTGFPFKVLQLEGTISDPAVYDARLRRCDLGYLRASCRKDDGTIGYRCPAEPQDNYLAKGGAAADVHGRKCLCNGLLATVGLGQIRDHASEPPLVTAGDDVSRLSRFLPPDTDSYTAADVIRFLLGEPSDHAATAAHPSAH